MLHQGYLFQRLIQVDEYIEAKHNTERNYKRVNHFNIFTYAF